MKRILVIIALAVFAAACSFVKESSKTGEKSETAEIKKPVAGDTIVGRWAGTSFYEAKVQSITGSKATVTWSDDNKTGEVDLSEAYLMPASGSKANVKVGDFVLAKTTSSGYSWDAAEVTKVDDGVIVVKETSNGNSSNVAPDKIIKVSPVLAADFKNEANENEFLKKAQTGRPRAPQGYEVKSGHRVVGEWTTNGWYAGHVQSVSGDMVKVAWEDGSKASDLAREKVVPHPEIASYAVPVINDYVLVKPNGTGRWSYAQVTSVSGSSVEVKMADGGKRTLKPGEWVNIG